MIYCDRGCPWPALPKKHYGVRLCEDCTKKYRVLPNGLIWPLELLRRSK